MFFTGPILYGESTTASRAIPVLPSRVSHWQWLDKGFVIALFELLLGSWGELELRAQNAWLAIRSPAATTTQWR